MKACFFGIDASQLHAACFIPVLMSQSGFRLFLSLNVALRTIVVDGVIDDGLVFVLSLNLTFRLP